MKNRLPVYIENRELPQDVNIENRKNREEVSYGYINILYILSLLITGASVITVLFLR